MKVQVNIARNDRDTDQPMDQALWDRFVFDVQQCLHKSTRLGQKLNWLAGGLYDCFDSGEESFFALADVSYGFDKVRFQNDIYRLTEKYNQDSIAVTYICEDSNFLIKNLNNKH